jgi:hypothetical protein
LLFGRIIFDKGEEISVVDQSGVNETDRSILRILADYEQLTPLQIWHEVGETGAVRPSQEEIVARLEGLTEKGLIERITGTAVLGNPRLSIYRTKDGIGTLGEADPDDDQKS